MALQRRRKPIAHKLSPLARHQPCRDTEPRMVIDTSECFRSGSIGHEEATHDVHLPQLHRRAAFPPLPILELALASAWVDRCRSKQAAVHRGPRGQRRNATAPQLTDDAARSPVRLPAPQLEDRRLHRRGHLIGTRRRSVGAVREPLQATRFVPGQPGMHRLPADPPIRGHLSDRLAIRDHCEDRLVPLFRHAECPHVRECQASPGTGVKHQPELCKGSAGYVLSRISRISTSDWLGRECVVSPHSARKRSGRSQDIVPTTFTWRAPWAGSATSLRQSFAKAAPIETWPPPLVSPKPG